MCSVGIHRNTNAGRARTKASTKAHWPRTTCCVKLETNHAYIVFSPALPTSTQHKRPCERRVERNNYFVFVFRTRFFHGLGYRLGRVGCTARRTDVRVIKVNKKNSPVAADHRAYFSRNNFDGKRHKKRLRVVNGGGRYILVLLLLLLCYNVGRFMYRNGRDT